MNIKKIHLDVISVEKKVFSGLVKKIKVTGTEGDLEIFPNHAPLLTTIKPGLIHIIKKYNIFIQEYIYISGGILEVQPNLITLLADNAIIGKDLDKKKVIESKKKAEYYIKNSKNNIDYVFASKKLEKAIAKLKVIELTRLYLKK